MITKTFNIDEANINKRLDSFLSYILDDISRGLVQQLIEQGNVLVNDLQVKKNYKLRLNDQIHVILQFPEVIEDEPSEKQEPEKETTNDKKSDANNDDTETDEKGEKNE